MATALDIIESAMGKGGYLAAGETVSAEDADMCLKALNSLVDSLENEGFFAYTTQDTVFTLPASTQSRTIGPAQQIDMVRPVKILRGSFTRLAGIDYKLEPVSEPEYNAISMKTGVDSMVPSVCFYDGGTPTGNVYFWPTVGASVEVHLITPESGGQAADLTTAYIFPPGYQRYLEYQLWVEVAANFGAVPTPFIVSAAANAKRLLKRTNARIPQLDLECDGAKPNILSGE